MSAVLEKRFLSPLAEGSAKLFRGAGKVFCAEVCEILDCGIRNDYLDDDGLEMAFAIGQPTRFSEGMLGFRASPYFGLLDDMEAFCKRHIGGFRALDLERHGVPYVWFWEKRSAGA